MLASAPFTAFIPVHEFKAAKAFYVGTLGLALQEDTPFAVVVDAGGTQLRLTQVLEFAPQPFTVAGWRVTGIESLVDRLVGAGVPFLRYDQMEQDERGIWTSPSGARVAWFKDPDGNTLSVTEAPRTA